MASTHSTIQACVMFTDIQGSSAIMEEDLAHAIDLINYLKEEIQSAHNEFNGEIIQFLGDGSLSIFLSVDEAIQAALSLQKRMRGKLEIPLRIGMHFGQVLRTKDGIIGESVNIASRIESFSIPGAILFSDSFHDQIKYRDDLSFKSQGTYHLKNIGRPVEVFALIDPSLVTPNPETLRGKGKNLQIKAMKVPRTLSSFVGRGKELFELHNLVKEHRLVTILGSGGTGKTRLSQEVGAGLLETTKSSVYWVNLATIMDINLVPYSIAEVLGIKQDPNKSMLEQTAAFLAEKSCIIILDNFEQVVDAATDIEYLLHNCEQIRFLITSRVPLGLISEYEYPIDPLPIPAFSSGLDPKKALSFPSISLFTQRAKRVRKGFSLRPDNIEAVAEICIQLDGLPLAIELAAARSKILSPRTMLTKIGNRLDLVKGGNRSLPLRHQALKETIMWSYDLLSNEEKELFGRLSVFSDGGLMEAIEAVCRIDERGALKELDIMDGVLGLVDKSLIRTNENEEIRFYMLATIREFADEFFQKSDAKEIIEKQHADYYLKLAEKAYKYLKGDEQAYWLSKLEDEQENIRKALNWCFTKQDNIRAYRFGTVLWRYWSNLSLLTEGLGQIKKILSLPAPLKDKKIRIRLLEGLGVMYVHLNTFKKAHNIFEETVRLWKIEGDEKQYAINLNHYGWTGLSIGNLDLGTNLSEQALAIHEKDNDLYGQAISYNNLAWISHERGFALKAINLWRKSGAFRKSAFDHRGYGFALSTTAMALREAGLYEEAIESVNKAFPIHEELKSNLNYYWDHMVLINIYLDENKLEECKSLLGTIHEKGFLIGSFNVSVNYYMFLARLKMYEGKFEEAKKLLLDNYSIAKDNGIDHCTKRILLALTQNACRAGWYEECLQFVNDGLEMCIPKGDLLRSVQFIECAGIVHEKKSNVLTSIYLLAFSTVQRKELGTPIPPVDEILLNFSVIKLKEQLGDIALFEKEWSKGLMLPIEEIIGIAKGLK